MKTKVFLILCLFLCIGLPQLSAQNGKNGNGAVTYNYPCNDFFQPIKYPGGEEFDNIEGTVIWHIIDHYKDGVNYESLGMAKDVDIYSTYTGEKFRILSCSNTWELATMTTTRHFDLVGDDGSHYIGSVIFDLNNYPTITMTVEKLVCPGDK